jgi:signal transduction histidine kinase
LSNAAFHTPPGTEVQLTAALDGPALLLVVADRGPGIPDDSIAHLKCSSPNRGQPFSYFFNR